MFFATNKRNKGISHLERTHKSNCMCACVSKTHAQTYQFIARQEYLFSRSCYCWWWWWCLKEREHTLHHHDIIHFTVAHDGSHIIQLYIVYSVMRVVCLRRSHTKLCFNTIWPLFNVIFKQYTIAL